jgi:hypothetical protein
MESFFLKLLVAIALVFLLALYMGYRSWGNLTPGKRALAIILLLPHFLLLACVGLSLSCGNAVQGSACYTQQFLSGVLIVFILPLPSLVGTAAALGMFITSR